jgi:NAD(P)-dependent dehydrogenase (short-subunit alcohol dehydrogenase family)
VQIVVMDGQGGGVGKAIAERLKEQGLARQIVVVGANAVATSNMMRAGVSAGATGENAVRYNCAYADVIIGPIGIILPNAMYGEITPAMARCVAESPARKILIPVQNQHVHIVGIQPRPLSEYIEEACAAVMM